MTDPFAALLRAFHAEEVRFVVFGVWGANYYARSASGVTHTQDRDLFLPLDAANLLKAWQACEKLGLELRAGSEPLDFPRDLYLAERVVSVQGLTQASDAQDFQVDLSLVMGSFRFDDIWAGRRTFEVDGVKVPVASLTDIVRAKEEVGRDKDKLFLATLAEELREQLKETRERREGKP